MAASASRTTGVTPKPVPEVEAGVSAYLPFVTPYKNAWEALRTEEITVRQLAAMRKSDGQARALYRLITLPIRAALRTATFMPEENVEGGEEEAAFIQQMFTLPASAGGMSVPFGRFIAQMLLAIFEGFSAFEMVYWVPQTGPLKGQWTLKKLAHRPAETLTFLLNDASEFAGFRQQTMYLGQYVDKEIPGDHSFYYAANEEERPFYGQSYFQSAFYHWDKKFKLYCVAHLAAQRAAVGTRIGKLPKNPAREEKLAFQRALADLGIAQWMTVPEDYTVDSLKETTGFDFLALINHHNSQMSKSVLAAFFDKEQGGGDSGKLVDFGTQSDALFLLMLQTIMAEIEETINSKIIPRFIDWNFGTAKYPRFQFGSLSQEQKNAMLELFKTLSVAGQSLTIRPEVIHELEKQISEELGLEIDWETIEEEMAYEAEQQRMQAEAQATSPGVAEGEALTGIDPSVVPPEFQLSGLDPGTVALTQLALGLLEEFGGELELTRGRPNAGGPKYVRTPEGAKTYGVPIGTPITPDIAQRTAADGVKGKAFGQGIRQPYGAKNTRREVLGGGLGAKAQRPGGVVTHPATQQTNVPKRILRNPKMPGAQLLDYGDGTVAIRDSMGHVSKRQEVPIAKFLALGWATSAAEQGKKSQR